MTQAQPKTMSETVPNAPTARPQRPQRQGNYRPPSEGGKPYSTKPKKFKTKKSPADLEETSVHDRSGNKFICHAIFFGRIVRAKDGSPLLKVEDGTKFPVAAMDEFLAVRLFKYIDEMSKLRYWVVYPQSKNWKEWGEQQPIQLKAYYEPENTQVESLHLPVDRVRVHGSMRSDGKTIFIGRNNKNHRKNYTFTEVQGLPPTVERQFVRVIARREGQSFVFERFENELDDEKKERSVEGAER